MKVGLFQTIFMIGAFVAFYGINFSFIAYFKGSRDNDSLNVGFTIAGMIVSILISLQPIVLPSLSFARPDRWAWGVQIAGFLFVGGSLVLQIWARLHLRQFYAEGADVQSEHFLVDTGPYALVRHPLFTAYLLFSGGLLLVTPGWLTLIILGYSLWDFRRAAQADERLLSKEIPGYTEYMQQVPPFIPRARALFKKQ